MRVCVRALSPCEYIVDHLSTFVTHGDACLGDACAFAREYIDRVPSGRMYDHLMMQAS